MKKLTTFSLFFFILTSLFAQTYSFIPKYFCAYGTNVQVSAQRISGGVDGQYSEELYMTGNAQTNGLGLYLFDFESRVNFPVAVNGDSVSVYIKLGNDIPIIVGGMVTFALIDVNGNQVGNSTISVGNLSSLWKKISVKIPSGAVRAISIITSSSQSSSSFFVSLRLDFDKIELWTGGVSQILTSFETDITGVRDLNEAPTEFQLSQNYPNPFNPVTVIKFQVLNSQTVNLKIYNTLGQEVATLVNEEKAPGNYEVKFDGSNLASGMYVYRLQAGEFVQVKKMLLLR